MLLALKHAPGSYFVDSLWSVPALRDLLLSRGYNQERESLGVIKEESLQTA